MKDNGFYKRLWTLAAPIALQSAVMFSVQLTDNVMVGALGEVAISGVFLAGQIQIMLQMLITGIGSALVVLAAQYWGKGDKGSVKRIVAIALQFSLVFACVFLGLMLVIPGPIIRLFSNNPQVIAEAMVFMQVFCFTFVFFCINNVLMSALRCVGVVKLGLYLSVTTFFINLFLNWVFIYGHLGMPAMGVQGSALSTLIARIVEFIILVVYLGVVDKKLAFRLRDLFQTNRVLLHDFLKYGLPIVLGDILWGLNLSVQGAIVGRLGADSIAAVSIANAVFSLFSVCVYGTASASAVIIGHTVGEGDLAQVKRYAGKLQRVFLGVGLVTGVLLFLFRDAVLLMYHVSGSTVDIARTLMAVLSITVVGTAYQMSTLTGIVRAGGAVHFVLINDIIFVWGIVIPLSLLSAFVWKEPTWVVFLCLKCDQILKCFVAVIKVNRFDWVKKLTKDFAAESA